MNDSIPWFGEELPIKDAQSSVVRHVKYAILRRRKRAEEAS